LRPLLAHIANPAEEADRRRATRRTLRLDVAAQSSTLESTAVIRNLSRTGMLIETDIAFAAGEIFLLVLPEIGATPARVVRSEGRSFGCEFLSPVPESAISGALLKAPYDEDYHESAGAVGEGIAETDLGIPRRPPNALLFSALTILFIGAILLLLVALASLSFSGDQSP